MNCDRCGKKFELTDWKYPLEKFTLCNYCYKKARKELGYDEDDDMQ